MSAEAARMFSLFGIGVLLTLVAGFYCVLTTKSLIRTIIGLELLTKAVTVLIIVAGYLAGQVALAQTLVITLIVIEVVVVVVAVGVILCVHRVQGDVDASTLTNIKG